MISPKAWHWWQHMTVKEIIEEASSSNEDIDNGSHTRNATAADATDCTMSVAPPNKRQKLLNGKAKNGVWCSSALGL